MTTKRTKPEAEEEVEANEELVELLENLVKLTKTSRKRKPEPEPEELEEPEEAEDAAEGDVEDEGEGEGEAEAEEPEEPAAEPAAKRPWMAIACAALAAALAISVTFAMTLWFRYDKTATSQDRRQEIAERAGVIARTMYNYDYHHTQDYLNAQAKVLSRSTAANVKQQWSTLSTFINTGQIVSTAQVNSIYVGDYSASKAVVVVDISTKLVTSKGISNLTNVFDQFHLVREHGVWVADGSPKIVGSGTETDTDLQGKPLSSASPSPSPSASAK
jgi:hypothetical protein